MYAIMIIIIAAAAVNLMTNLLSLCVKSLTFVELTTPWKENNQ